MPTEKEVYTSVYDLDYYTGSQCSIYIGDVWVDEVTSLQYVTQQTKRPIRGYASQLWDDCAAGHVQVQGSFTINFKEQGYLWAVLRRYFEIASIDALGMIDPLNAKYDKALFKKQKELGRKGNSFTPGALDNRPLVGSNGTQISRASIERLIRGEATTGERYEFYHSLASYASFDTKNPRDKTFEDIVEVFEDQVWGVENTNQILNSQLRRMDDNRFDNFDMYVVFGNYSNSRANHTVQKIVDVRLLSQSKMIKIDGEPVQEGYDFIARTVV